jgi:hypothetical protein
MALSMTTNRLRAELDALLERLVRGLRGLPGATELHLCGSHATSHADAYSVLLQEHTHLGSCAT